jgi:O-antigen biosynthesis protein WbqP
LYRGIKRFLDVIFSLAGLIVLSPLFLALFLCIRIESKGPAIFAQKRIGRRHKHFYIYKFRTMRADTPKDVPTHLLENADQYITRTGRFLRRTSLDELPQLFNILQGEMSIVGPRPALWNQYDLVRLRENNGANNLKPGLTGWAQVNGRDELPVAIKARLDGEYVKKMSLAFDWKIIMMTIKKTPAAEGVKH